MNDSLSYVRPGLVWVIAAALPMAVLADDLASRASIYEQPPPVEARLDMTTRVDLRASMELGGRHLVELLSPDKNYLPYWNITFEPQSQDSRFNLGWPAHNLGRWWDAMLRLENATGYMIPAKEEGQMLKNLEHFFDNEDHIVLTPFDMEENPSFDLHSCREGLLALTALVIYRQNHWAQSKGTAMVGSLWERIDEQGNWLPEKFACLKDPRVKKNEEEFLVPRWTTTHGRLLEAVVRFYQASGAPEALQLADRLARVHYQVTVDPNGFFPKQCGAGHSHSYYNTLRGLLLYGELTGQQSYIQAIANTYKNTVCQWVRESGYSPHDVGGGVREEGSVADAAQLALWLGTRHGYTDYLDDVERLVRARLLPSQIVHCPPLNVNLPPEQKKHGANLPTGPVYPDQYRDLERRALGAYGGLSWAAHAGKQPTTDIDAAVLHGLADIYRHIAVLDGPQLKIHFHFDYDDEHVSIRSVRNKRADVRILLKQRCNVWLRLPTWAPRDSLELSVNGAKEPLILAGSYLRISRQKMPGEIRLAYALPVKTTREKEGDGEFQFLWRGDEILGIHPNHEDLFPFYPTYNPAKP